MLGATNPIVEMQSRWYVSVLTGATSLPSSAAMQQHARREQQRIAARFTDRSRHRMQVDYLPYMDELGAEIAAVPSPLGQLVHLRPRLAWNLLFGPAVPAQFRLQGPHPWPHAPAFITHARYPARRVVDDTLRTVLWTGVLLIGAASAIAAGLFMATARQK
jgi:dimethylaniline monooxygenase (N-oxide forming)